ncbi:peptidyl-prolyl cis-trans isomerase [Citrus sinensis]|uniref:Peptidyl-prolyl cis-trans isomerase n=1 Tax=Citrus sinensis TaxID=2711 RepID=A0ACB8JZR8_CITSI|nr:peptidyl-prolyl cis-trans isomerase [Citrus sinensis]KAH9738098.1 peptidyl-prolyl cis-trans isomerase [Citrus sinensis]
MLASDDGPPEVTLETSMGSFTVELYYKHSPRTCRNFAELSRRGYYNNSKFHRIIKDFIVQGGDPTGTGRGGDSIYGHVFEDEIKPELKHTGAGILSMANAGPNTNGSQFFITLAPASHLDESGNTITYACVNLARVYSYGLRTQLTTTCEKPCSYTVFFAHTGPSMTLRYYGLLLRTDAMKRLWKPTFPHDFGCTRASVQKSDSENF